MKQFRNFRISIFGQLLSCLVWLRDTTDFLQILESWEIFQSSNNFRYDLIGLYPYAEGLKSSVNGLTRKFKVADLIEWWVEEEDLVD